MPAAEFPQSLTEPVALHAIVRFNRSHEKRPMEALQESRVSSVLLVHDFDDLGAGLTVDRGRRVIYTQHASVEENLSAEHGDGHVDGVGCAEGSHASGNPGCDEEIRVFLESSVSKPSGTEGDRGGGTVTYITNVH